VDNNFKYYLGEYKSFNKKSKKAISDLCSEVISEYEMMPESRKDRLRGIGFNEDCLRNLVVIPSYPPKYQKELEKGNSCSDEAEMAFKDRNHAIYKLQEFMLVKILTNDKLFLKYGIEENLWAIQVDFVKTRKFIKQIEASEKKMIEYKLVLKEDREIFINGERHDYKPQSGGENHKVLQYLVDNPNKEISKEEINSKLGKSVGKDFSKIVDNFNLNSKYRKAFFPSTTKNSIVFRNPVYKGDI